MGRVFGLKTAVVFVVCSVLLFSAANVFCQKREVIRIGCPLSTAFLYGWVAERGVKLAVEEINAAGGLNVGGKRYSLEVAVIDTRDLEPGVPVSEALLAVEKLILEKKVDFLVGGPIRSEAALASMDLVSRYKKVHIYTTGVLTPLLHQRIAENYDKYKYIFRNTNHSANMVREFLVFIEEHTQLFPKKKAYVMVQDVEHARRGGEIMSKALAEKGWEVAGFRIYPTGATDYSVGLQDAKAKDVDLLFIWMDMPESSILLKQWADMKLMALPMGFVCAAEQPGFWKATGGKGEYLIVNVVNGGNVPGNITPWTPKFVEAYKKRWGIEPEGYGTASSYMAVYQLKEAVERAGSLDPEKVVAALEDLDMMGVYGRMRFDKRSHQIIPSFDPNEGAVTCIFQWQAGKRVQVFPSKVAVGKVVLPPWMKAR